jgi:uncharacterized protein (DUF736 family)
MTTPYKAGVSLLKLRSPSPWLSCLLTTGEFPLDQPLAAGLWTVLSRLCTEVARAQGLTRETFIQLWRLPLGDAADRFNAGAPNWMPEIGLGVWPNRKPPARWTKETFVDAAAGDEPPISRHKVVRITASETEREKAFEIMFGCGTLLQIMTDASWDDLQSKARDSLLTRIEDPEFRKFRFYVPLLEGAAVQAADSSQLNAWACGAKVYVRESTEDKGVLLVSAIPLDPIFESLGWRREAGPEEAWRIPVTA